MRAASLVRAPDGLPVALRLGIVAAVLVATVLVATVLVATVLVATVLVIAIQHAIAGRLPPTS